MITLNEARRSLQAAARGDWRIVETTEALARVVAEGVYAERMTPGQWGTTGIGDTMRADSAGPAEGDLAARIASVTSPHRVVMVDIETTGELVEIARDAGQVIADLKQRLADKEADCVRLVNEKANLWTAFAGVRAWLAGAEEEGWNAPGLGEVLAGANEALEAESTPDPRRS